MRLLSALTRNPRGTDRGPAESLPSASSDLREEALERGLDARRALALAEALEREGRVLDAVDALVQANRLLRDDAVERRLVRLRRSAFAHLDRSLPPPPWPPVVPDDAPGAPSGPLIVTPAQLTPGAPPERLLSGTAMSGCEASCRAARAQRLRAAIDRTFDAYDEDQTPAAARRK